MNINNSSILYTFWEHTPVLNFFPLFLVFVFSIVSASSFSKINFIYFPPPPPARFIPYWSFYLYLYLNLFSANIGSIRPYLLVGF